MTGSLPGEAKDAGNPRLVRLSRRSALLARTDKCLEKLLTGSAEVADLFLSACTV